MASRSGQSNALETALSKAHAARLSGDANEVSRDGGYTFTLEQQPNRQGLSAVLPLDDGGIVLVGEFGAHRADAFSGTSTP